MMMIIIIIIIVIITTTVVMLPMVLLTTLSDLCQTNGYLIDSFPNSFHLCSASLAPSSQRLACRLDGSSRWRARDSDRESDGARSHASPDTGAK